MPISIGNRVTEKDIRDWLDANGFVGRTAKINDLELHAIERPGWVQVFEFQMRSKIRPTQISTYQDEESEAELEPAWLDRFGVVLDDERKRTQSLRTQIWVFEDREGQQAKLESVSQGMLVRNSGSNSSALLWIAVTAILFLAIVSLVSWVTWALG